MPTETLPSQVENAFQGIGCGWILEDVEREKLLVAVAAEIDEFRDEFHKRFGSRPDPFELLTANSEKATAFFQAFTGPPLSVNMRIVIWRLLHGCEILGVQLNYERKKPFQAQIVIGGRGAEPDQAYTTTNPWDFVVLRHFGVLTINGQLVLDGYYALQDFYT